MELLRYGHDAWGQVVVNGLSWSLLPVVVGAGATVIVVHLIVRAFTRRGGAVALMARQRGQNVYALQFLQCCRWLDFRKLGTT